MSTDVQRRLAAEVEERAPRRLGLLQRDPEYRSLRRLAALNRRWPPKNPTEALQHVADVAREMTRARFSALAVTGGDDYVQGFMVSGMPAEALAALKAPPQGHGPLGTMRQDGLAVHFEDVGAHEKAFGFPPKHPEMRELLGVPIFAGAEVRGALYVTDRRDGKRFGPDDEAVLRVLSRHAGLIIDASWY